MEEQEENEEYSCISNMCKRKSEQGVYIKEKMGDGAQGDIMETLGNMSVKGSWMSVHVEMESETLRTTSINYRWQTEQRSIGFIRK